MIKKVSLTLYSVLFIFSDVTFGEVDQLVEFNLGEEVAVCYFATGERVGLTNGVYDNICEGPVKIISSRNESGEYFIQDSTGASMLASSQFLGKIVTNSVDPFNYKTLNIGQKFEVCELLNDQKFCYQLIVQKLAKVKYSDSNNYILYVKFEGYNIWLDSAYLRRNRSQLLKRINNLKRNSEHRTN